MQLIEAIRQVVAFDAYVWLLTDPETSVGSSPIADVPCLPELPRLIRLKYLTEVNRWTAQDASSVALLQGTTEGDLARSLLWHELLGRYDINDMASAVFRDRFGCWGFLDLWRSGSGRFSQAEAAFLNGILTPVTAAVRRCQANTFVVRSSHDSRRLGPVVLLLSPDLEVHAQTPEVREYLRVLIPTVSEDSPPIPASAYNVGAQLLALEANVDRNPPSARVHLSDGLWVTLRAARIGDAPSSGKLNIAVTIEDASPSERVALFTRAFGFSTRESELLGYLVTGSDTREVARRMFLSEHTVQDHLKSIFSKTSTRNRRTLLSRALGS